MALLHDYFGVSSAEIFAEGPVIDWKQRAPEDNGMLTINSSNIGKPESLVPGTVSIVRIPESGAHDIDDAVLLKYTLDSALKGLCVEKVRRQAADDFTSMEISDLSPRDIILRDEAGLYVPHNLDTDASGFVFTTFATLVAERYTQDSARADPAVQKLLEEFGAPENPAILTSNV